MNFQLPWRGCYPLTIVTTTILATNMADVAIATVIAAESKNHQFHQMGSVTVKANYIN